MGEYCKYFTGEYLFGDNFPEEKIARWYDEEAEAYADLYGKNMNTNQCLYGYHKINKLYGYRYLEGEKIFENVLGFGSSWGFEFLPVIDKIKNLTMNYSVYYNRKVIFSCASR
jgi:hypothetical protein